MTAKRKLLSLNQWVFNPAPKEVEALVFEEILADIKKIKSGRAQAEMDNVSRKSHLSPNVSLKQLLV